MTTKSKNKGQRIVEITPEFLESMFVHGAEFETNLPDDARLISVELEGQPRWQYLLKFESAEWDALVEGEKIPTFSVDVAPSSDRNQVEWFLSKNSMYANNYTDERKI